MKLKLFSRRNRRKTLNKPADQPVMAPTQGGGPESFKLYRKDRSAQPKKRGRHSLKITFVGDEGKPWRIAAALLAAVIVLVAVLAALRNDTQVMSMPEISVVKDAGVLTVGVRDDMVGMAYNGAGFEVELGLLLAERILPDIPDGNAVKYVTVNSMTVGPKLSDGTVDVGICMMQKDASSQYAYSDVYYKDTVRFVIRDGERITASNITVGCIQNSVAESRLKTYIESKPANNILSRSFAAYDDMLTALMNKTIDAVVITDLYLNKYDDAYAITGTGLDLGAINYAVACPIDSPAIAEAATILLNELRESGKLDELYRKYGFAAQISGDAAAGQ